MEEVLRRENVSRAYDRVVRNRGAPGVDGMSVAELLPDCRMHWARIREELFQGTYKPQPVRRVEIRRRTDVAGIFPNREAILRLVTAVLNDQHDEWAVGRRHMSLESLGQVSARSESAINAPAIPEAA